MADDTGLSPTQEQLAKMMAAHSLGQSVPGIGLPPTAPGATMPGVGLPPGVQPPAVVPPVGAAVSPATMVAPNSSPAPPMAPDVAAQMQAQQAGNQAQQYGAPQSQGMQAPDAMTQRAAAFRQAQVMQALKQQGMGLSAGGQGMNNSMASGNGGR